MRRAILSDFARRNGTTRQPPGEVIWVPVETRYADGRRVRGYQQVIRNSAGDWSRVGDYWYQGLGRF